MQVLGLNPNRIAETLAPLLIFCSFGMLYEPSRTWRMVCFAVTFPAAALLLATGSRAGFCEAAVGFVVLMLPLVRRPGVFFAAAAVVMVGGVAVLGLVEQSRAYEIGQYNFTNRMDAWSSALAMFMQRPVIGIGWARMATEHGYGSSINMLSIYMQVLAEVGLLGALAMAAALAWIMRRAWRTWRLTANDPALRPFVFLAGALLFAVLVHGGAESGALMGSGINAACLGITTAMLDWLFRMVHVRWRRRWAVSSGSPWCRSPCR